MRRDSTTTARGLVWFFCLVLTFGLLILPGAGSLNAAEAAELPEELAVSDIARIDFHRGDTGYRSLFPDLEADREKINRLVELYNRARGSLGEETSLYGDDPDVMPFFLHRVRFTLAGDTSVTMVLHEGVGLYTETPERGRRVTDAALGEELAAEALGFFEPAQGVEVDSRRWRMGAEVTVTSDAARGEEAHILLMPSYRPVTVPSAPAPYPVPEAVLVATVPVEHDRFSYTFTLEEQTGLCPDGSPGEIGPGAWNLVVNSGSGETMLPVTILPAERPQPRAVVYQRDRVYAWTAPNGVTSGVLSSADDRPLLASEADWGSPVTQVGLGFLDQWLDIPVRELESGRYGLGEPELGLTVAAGEDAAHINGTMVGLGGRLAEQGEAWRLPWTNLGRFFGYRVQWAGPQTVVFLRELDEVPDELQDVLKPEAPAARGEAVTVASSGRKLDLGTRGAFLDPVRGRVMVPFRSAVESLGGFVEWFPLESDYAETAAAHNYGLPPTGADVSAYAEAAVGDRRWRVYLTPAHNSDVVVPLRDLALALGYELSWDGTRNRADLRAAD